MSQPRTDTERMDWLVRQHVEVRLPLLYGSRAMFTAQTMTDEEDDHHATDLRRQIDACMDSAPRFHSMDTILQLLRADPRRDIYGGAQGHGKHSRGAGEYFITYQGGGPFSKEAVMQLVRDGVLRRKFPDGECYCLAEPR